MVTRAVVVATTLLCTATGAEARQVGDAEEAYLRAVARYFQMPDGEVSILAHWGLAVDEIPVALFVARRAGISPEALVALRETGRTWTALVRSYNIGANSLHVPLRDPAAAGSLTPAYERFRDTPVPQWAAVQLSDGDIIALVNVRVLSQSLGVAPDDIARRTGTTATFVELYGRMLR